MDIDSGYHFGSDRIIIIMIIIHSCTASIPFNLNNIVAIWLGMVLVVINQYVALVAAYLYNHRQYCCNNIITGFPFLCGLPLWVQTRNQNRHCILITTLLPPSSSHINRYGNVIISFCTNYQMQQQRSPCAVFYNKSSKTMMKNIGTMRL